MPEFYDRYETRAPRSRDAALLRDLRGILSVAKSRAAGLRHQLKNIELDSLKGRADLAQIPVVRATDLTGREKEMPPFGGACATRPGALLHLLMAQGAVFLPEGHAKDWWNAARALYAAGIRKGDVVLNCFPYHFVAEGHMLDSGLRALGCPVIPAGDADLAATLTAIAHYAPTAYCGPSDYLVNLAEKATQSGQTISSLKRAFIGTSPVSPETKMALAPHDIALYSAYAPAHLGVVAYETEARDAFVVSEGLIVEIVRPGSNDPLPAGQFGEIVVTRLNADYPLLRFGTGDISAIVGGPSPCGRTNMRIARVQAAAAA
ncbi:MAG TPA: AMP-binding protein [Methylovirgula sp.]|jgi:phenylacetate-CoA ligase|nr:AMP-binding protein [Methylovirgula sp.]